MPSPRDLREREVQRRADVVNATIDSRNDDGTYDCTDTKTGQTFRASKANRNDEFSPGTRVVVAPTGNSRRTVGAGAVIISRAPQESRGVALFSRSALARYLGPIVTSLLPSPLRIPIGFTTGRTLTIRGYSLSAAATYEHADITDATAQVIASTSITCSIKAASTAPEGFFDVTVHGRTFADALQLYAVGEHIYVACSIEWDLGGGNSAITPCVVGIKTLDWTVDRTLVGGIITNEFPESTPGILLNGETIVTLTNLNSGGLGFLTVSKDTDSNDVTETGDIGALNGTYRGSIAWNGSKVALLSNGATKKLYTAAIDGTSVVEVADLSAYAAQWNIYWDGTYYWLTSPNGPNVLRVTTGGVVAAVAASGTCNSAVHSGSYLYASGGGGTTDIHKIDIATAAITSTLSMGGSSVPHFMLVVGTNLYVQMNLNGTSGLRKIDLGTFTTTSTLTWTGTSIPVGYGTRSSITLSADGLKLYVLVYETVIVKKFL